MRKIFPSLILVCIRACTTAQTNQQKIDSVTTLIKQYFNAKDADALYALGGEAFKSELSADQFKQICNNNLFPLGSMQTTFESNNTASINIKLLLQQALCLHYMLVLMAKTGLIHFYSSHILMKQIKKQMLLLTIL